jgi:2,4-dienoyl-CoA reductase-like NADH-dependent reductase (Old Yellow Enzyme family)
LIDNFLWAGTNRRTDRYGTQRTAFATEVICAVRERVGTDFPVGMRISQWKMKDYQARIAATRRELDAILRPVVAAGLDLVHVSTRRYWEPSLDDDFRPMATIVRELTGIPTIAVGSVGLKGPAFESAFAGGAAEVAPLTDLRARLKRDEFDLVAVGRALLADPSWTSKVRDGREDDIKPFHAASLFEDFG